MGKKSNCLSKLLSLILASAMIVTCMPARAYALEIDADEGDVLLTDTGSDEMFTGEGSTPENESFAGNDGNTGDEGITGEYAAFEPEEDLADRGRFGNDTAGDSNTIKYTFSVTYGQTEARSMLAMVNDFRTGNEAWAWNEANTQKVSYPNLGNLQYDYGLEKTAMQRAAEIALYWEHTRPDGTKCFTAYSNSSGSRGENIAVGQASASAAFTAWEEKDKNYAGQGHRRNMLESSFGYIGIGHAVVNGTHYWVQELQSVPTDTASKTALDSSKDVDVDILPSLISSSTYELASNNVTVGVGETATLPAVTGRLTMSESWPKNQTVTFKNAIVNWQTTAQDVVSINGNTVTGLKAGSATLTTSVASIPITVTVTGSGGGGEGDDSQYYWPYTITVNGTTGFAIDWDRVPTLAQVKAAGGNKASDGYVVNVNGVLHIAKTPGWLDDYSLRVPLICPTIPEGYDVYAEITYDTNKAEPHYTIGYNGTDDVIAFRFFANTFNEEQINEALSSMSIKLFKYEQPTVKFEASEEAVSVYRWLGYKHYEIPVGSKESIVYNKGLYQELNNSDYSFVVEPKSGFEVKSVTATRNGAKATISKTTVADPDPESQITYDVYTVSGVEDGDELVVTVTTDGSTPEPQPDPVNFDYTLNYWTSTYDGKEYENVGIEECIQDNNFFNVEISGCTEEPRGTLTDYYTTGSDITVTLSSQVKPADEPDSNWDAPIHDLDRYDCYAKYWFESMPDSFKTVKLVNNTFTIPAEDVKTYEASQTSIIFNIFAIEKNTTLIFEQGTFDKFSINYIWNYNTDQWGSTVAFLTDNKICIRKDADYQGLYVSLNEEGKETVTAVKLSEDKTNWTTLTEVKDEYGSLYWIIPKSMTTSPKYVAIETENIIVNADWGDVDDSSVRSLFGNDPSNIPEDIWYTVAGTNDYFTKGCTVAFNDTDRKIYTGNPITFNGDIAVYCNNTRLWENRDYTVSYANNTAAALAESQAAPSFTIKAKGNYTGSAIFKFDINKAAMNDAAISSDKTVLIDAGKALNSAKLEVIFGGKKLSAGTDFTVSYHLLAGGNPGASVDPATQAAAGTSYAAVISAGEASCFTGSMSDFVEIKTVNPKDANTVPVSKLSVKIPNQKWTGDLINVAGLFSSTGPDTAPAATVTYGRDTLVYGRDYTVEYGECRDAGEYQVTIRGTEGAGGSQKCYIGIKKVKFKVEGTSSGKVKIACLNTSPEYKGRTLSRTDLYKADKTGFKEVTLYKTEGKTNVALTEGKDYTVEMSNTGALGKFDIVFKLMGGYTGELRKTINVKAYDFGKDNAKLLQINPANAIYNKAGATPQVVVTFDGNKLKEGVDYTLSYKNNKMIATDLSGKKLPTAVVSGMGNFKGKASAPFIINKAPVSQIKLSLTDKDYKQNQSKGYYRIKPKLVDHGKNISNKKDIVDLGKDPYKFYYADTNQEIDLNAADVGPNRSIKVKVHVTAAPNSPYTGSTDITGTYRLIEKDKNIKNATVTLINEEALTFSDDEDAVMAKASDFSLIMKGTTTPLTAGTDYKLVSVTGTRTSKNIIFEFEGTGAYGGRKTLKLKVANKKIQ